MTSFDLNHLFKVAILQTQLHSEVLRETTSSYDGWGEVRGTIQPIRVSNRERERKELQVQLWRDESRLYIWRRKFHLFPQIQNSLSLSVLWHKTPISILSPDDCWFLMIHLSNPKCRALTSSTTPLALNPRWPVVALDTLYMTHLRLPLRSLSHPMLNPRSPYTASSQDSYLSHYRSRPLEYSSPSPRLPSPLSTN